MRDIVLQRYLEEPFDERNTLFIFGKRKVFCF
jgi:hypothetical protein